MSGLRQNLGSKMINIGFDIFHAEVRSHKSISAWKIFFGFFYFPRAKLNQLIGWHCWQLRHFHIQWQVCCHWYGNCHGDI